ncbi:dihydropteroate synthase [Desulfogranum marinum]|uniref:dihydropteroate synthase n=1 Tax=Desulfogranum marinum TaxID=453220 RepID=UPI001965D50D|nr:dihydropteroate synthase [Desulfogranum marinum]MBM9511359.1 dihydropteroate synthase [Desulfogranum marinum]
MASATKVMGILNVTPDSFSDGGRYTNKDAIQKQIVKLVEDGADIIDVGGESSRPFAEAIDADEEMARVLPAITQIRQFTSIPVSIDTTKALVAKAALAAGATMVNDISALRQDPEMVEVVASYSGPVIIMHMQGNPDTMQIAPQYTDVVEEINTFFTQRLAWMEKKGIDRRRIIIDPGIGFGKSVDHNLAILRNIREFKKHGCQVLVGHSRKSFFDHLLGIPVTERDLPTAIVSALCVQKGVDILRVHDVKKNVCAVALSSALS